MPPAWMRALIDSSAAMPMAAHGPHSTDVAFMARVRRQAPSESSMPLAAA